MCASGWPGAGAARTSLTTSSQRSSHSRSVRVHTTKIQPGRLFRRGVLLIGWRCGRPGSNPAFCQRQHHSKRRERSRGKICHPFFLSILFCYRLSYTQPFRNSVVDGDGVYTGEDTLVRNGKRLAAFFSGDDQGGFEWRRMGSKNCIRQYPN